MMFKCAAAFLIMCKTFCAWQVTYSRHMEGHKRNTCSKCSQSFCSHKKLKAHMKSEHNFDLLSKTYPCQTCSRSFLKRSSLYYHLKLHATEDEVNLFPSFCHCQSHPQTNQRSRDYILSLLEHDSL